MKKVKRNPKKLKISACYIVKNNADELKTSIESLKHAADEIIVVDTGSTDSTVEVAKNFGAKVFYREWDDDFSAPRNLALENATGDWIIFLDSDEYFSDETKKNIRIAIEQAEKFKSNGILLYRLSIDKTAGGGVTNIDFSSRIFKNQQGLHYVGKIHEYPVIGNISLNLFTAPKEVVTIYHTGYAKALSKEKSGRNLKILLSELAKTSDAEKLSRLYWHLTQDYYTLGDLANAEKFARLYLKSNGEWNTS